MNNEYNQEEEYDRTTGILTYIVLMWISGFIGYLLGAGII